MNLVPFGRRVGRPVAYATAVTVFAAVLSTPFAPQQRLPLLSPSVAAAATAEGERLGLEPFWNYETTQLGGDWALSTHTATGNLVLSKQLLAVPGRGPALAEALTFNSQSGADAGVSPGWMLLTAQSVVENADGSVTFRDSDGTRHGFTRNTDGSYAKPAGVHLNLAQVSAGVFTLTDTALTRSRFEGGRLVSIIDERGQALTVSRDSTGRVTTMTDATGRKLSYAWDTAGRLASITDPAARVVTLGYDANGRLGSVADAQGNVTSFGYDSTGRAVSVTDANGAVTGIGYDTAGRVGKIIDARTTSTQEYATSFGYDEATGTTTVTDAGGNRTSVVHNSAGNPVEVTDPSGKKITQTWSGNELTKEADAAGSVSVSYDGNGNVTGTAETISSTQNATTAASYDSRNNPVAVTDENGSRTELKYDAKSNLTSQVTPALKEADANTYDSNGNLTAATDPGAATFNMVDNGSFETLDSTGKPVGWAYGKTTSAISVDTTAARYGANSLKMTATSSTDAIAFSNMIAAQPGQKFTLSGFGRLDTVSGIGAALGLHFYDVNGVSLGWEYTESYQGTGLLDFAVTAVAPAGTAKAAAVLEYSRATGTVLFDGIQLETPLAPGEGNILTDFDYVANSSFEYGGRNWFAGGAGSISVINTDAWGGSNSGQVSLSTAGTGYLYTDKIGVRAGENLTLSGLLKISNVTGNGAYAQVSFYDAAGASLGGVRTTAVAGSSDWIRYASATTAPTGAVSARIFALINNGTGTARFDNLKLVPRTTSRYSYDSAGNYRTGETDPLGNTTSYSYDAVGGLTAVTDPAGNTTRTEYDANNRPVILTDAAGGVTRFGYDKVGSGVVVRDARSASATDDTYATRYGYDPVRERTTLTDPLGRTSSYSYDRAARLIGTTNPSGSTVTMSYDAAGRPTGKALSDSGAAYSLGYDSSGNLISVTDEASRTASASYDAAHRLTGESDLWGYVQSFTRDAGGNLTSVGDGEKTTQYGYGTNNRLLSVTDGAGRTTRYSYDDTGRTFEIVRGDTLKTVLTYDDADRVVSIADPGNPHNGHLRYDYDSRGNITAAHGPTGTEKFSYDALNRLISWTDQNGAITRYSYDPVGNLTGKGDRTFTHDAAGQISSPGFTHDGNGNLTSDGSHNYSYDAAGRLTAVSKTADGSAVASYTYDHRGLRTSKTTASGTVRFHWNHLGQLVRESDTTGATLARYTWTPDDQLVVIEKNGVPYYPHTNARGDILAITDSAGAKVATYSYGPWGEQIAQTGTFTQPWRYAGYYTDTETGLYYLQQRYYDSTLSRFLTEEPLYSNFCADCGFDALLENAPTTSAYAYSYNRPTIFVDPDGLHPRHSRWIYKKTWYLSKWQAARLANALARGGNVADILDNFVGYIPHFAAKVLAWALKGGGYSAERVAKLIRMANYGRRGVSITVGLKSGRWSPYPLFLVLPR
jgi:RHS repeat-associated protein